MNISRRGKSSVVVPLDSLIKEKENTNRPTAARSAGTVGKWGKMGFTSTRTYTLKALPPSIAAAQSPQEGDCPVSSVNEAPKPKKFFKSRNSVPDVVTSRIIHHLPRAPPSPIRVEPAMVPGEIGSLKIKIPKPNRERKKSVTIEKPVKIKKKKEDEKKLKPEAPPTRRISRNRKVVNYNEEDDDRSSTPLRDILFVPNQEPQQENNVIMEPPPQLVPKPTPIEHPPIVLRISKGTSRLISTDSEEYPTSPANEAPAPEPTPIASTEDLLATLSGGDANEIPAEGNQNAAEAEHISPPTSPVPQVAPVAEKAPPPLQDEEPNGQDDEEKKIKAPTPVPQKLESLKIVIKTDVLKSGGSHEKSERKKSKKHRKAAANLKIIEHQFKTPSPQSVTENLEQLYRTTISPSDRDFDSQSSILGSVSSKGTQQFPVAIPDESCVIRSRGSSDVTSDLETSQHSSLVAPPSDIESRLESMMDCDDDEPIAAIAAEAGITDENKLSLIPEEPLTDDILKVLSDEPEVQEEEEQAQKPEEEEQRKEVEPENTLVEPEVASSPTPVVEEPPPPPTKRVTRGRKGAKAAEPAPVAASPPEPVKEGRVTRNNNNGNIKTKKPPPAPVRNYGRRRKNAQPAAESATIEAMDLSSGNQQSTEPEPATATETPEEEPAKDSKSPVPVEEPVREEIPPLKLSLSVDNSKKSADESTEKEYKIRSKLKRTWYEREAKQQQEEQLANDAADDSFELEPVNSLSSRNSLRSNSKLVNNNNNGGGCQPSVSDDDKRSVKLVISKKKGSIFKSRSLVADQGGDSKKRHVYKHTWDADYKKEKLAAAENSAAPSTAESIYDDEFNNEESSTSKLTRVTRQNSGKFEDETVTRVTCDRKAKEYYTVVRNVKTAHQIQEIGEYQEMDDDVEYILDALQPHNPIPTRCLSAIQLASKCMTPAFRMHVRAHGTVTKFFKALKDAKHDISLGLCTATIMFVLSQDTLNMDLDRDSLELMMNLLESDVCNPLDENSLTNFERNKQKVKEICEDIKSQGKAAHLNIESISVGTLAMETLLSMTSKRAGEWFKEELRELGGLEHIIKTICECCQTISDYVVNWTEVLLDKLRTIERCLRVLENVSTQNETNQSYILSYSGGNAVNTLVKLYKLCDSEIALYPTSDSTPKENPGVVLREALLPTLKVLINLSHPFDSRAIGSSIIGSKVGIFDTSFHILLQAPNYIPERCIFDLSILVLLLLINLTMHTVNNRTSIIQSHAPSDFGNQFDKVPAIKALIEYFYKCEEQARLAEKNTDEILENPDEKNKKQSQEEVDETVTKLLQKAGHHMEHTLQASYAGILIGHLISNSKENEEKIRPYLQDNSFKDIVSILEKYYNFMNLTASAEASVVSHIKSTKNLIDYFKKCDTHSNSDNNSPDGIVTNCSTSEPTPSSSVMATRSTPRVYKTYSQR